MTTDPIAPLEASIDIAAAPPRVWAVVSDLRRMGEWSPECRKVIVWGKEIHVGTWVTGINRRRMVVWPTNSKVHLYDEGRAIGWTVLENRARWSYDLAADGAGTRLTERREMPDGISPVGAFLAAHALGGVDEHSAELLAGMHTTLERIKAAAQS